MITAAPPTTLRLTRRALAAWPRWREKSGIDRRNWERHCELADAEIRALETLAANVAADGPMPGWFDGTAMQMRPESARKLLQGLTLAERDLPAFIGLWPVSAVVMPIWMERTLRKRFEGDWAQEKAAERLQQQRRDQERTAREAVIRAEQEREQEARIAQAAAEFEARRAQREQEQRQEQPAARQGRHGDPKPMQSTATHTPLNGTHPPAVTATFPTKPAKLSPLESDVWDQLVKLGFNPRLDVGHGTKQRIADLVDSTAGSVGQALSQIRRKLRGETDPEPRQRAAIPPAAPQSGTPETKPATPVSAAIAPENAPDVHDSAPVAENVAPTFPDPRHWDGEQRLKELSDQCAAQMAVIGSLEERTRKLEAELDQVTTDRARAWEELHDLKNPPQPNPTELTERLAALESQNAELQTRYQKALGDREEAFAEVQRLRETPPTPTRAEVSLAQVDGLDREASRSLRRLHRCPELSLEQKRTALQLACSMGENTPEEWSEILRRAQDAVEVVIA